LALFGFWILSLARKTEGVSGAADLVTTDPESDKVGVTLNTYVVFADGFEWGDTWPLSGQEP